MTKKRIAAIEYIRGISMIGVIGIHTGSQYLSNPSCNIHLAALFEVVTRFSVPIFFFISAFGLFYNLDIKEKFNYREFMARRFKSVLIPYLVWSLIYLAHYSLTYRDFSPWNIFMLLKYLMFGLSSYQLYFLVILLWFYALMPVWIQIMKQMNTSRLLILLLLQIAFDYYSSFLLTANGNHTYWKMLIEYRLNYWVFHYLFIFLLGGYAAVHFTAFYDWMKRCYTQIQLFFFLTLAALLGHYYYLIYNKQYSVESAINTAHQLSPAGIFYTVGASLFFFAVFSFVKLPARGEAFLSLLGKHSYFAYLFHPFAIDYLSRFVAAQGKMMTAPITIVFYAVVAAISIGAAIITERVGARVPMINLLLLGKSLPKKFSEK